MAKQIQIRSELERILASPGFRTSKRSQEFLRYIVEKALAGQFDDLKERVIGNQVFHRCPDYDTGEHSIVRVKANELRKRLAQFYAESGDPEQVQIQLPRGSYIPEFQWQESAAEPMPSAKPARSARTIRLQLRIYASAASLVLLTVASWYFFPGRRQAALEARFWQPVLQEGGAPMICVADPEVLKLDARYNALAFNGALPPVVPASDLIRDSDHYVGWGDALALARLSTFFALRHHQAQIRTGNDVSFADLNQAPLILIGARSNTWTMQLANHLRFVFQRTDAQSLIRDTTDPSKQWAFQVGSPMVDYVLVSRILQSKTGKPLIVAAGLSTYGTQVAGEILTQPDSLSAALRNAPHGWDKMNLQLLFRVEIYGKTTGPPTLVASSYW